MHHLTKTRSAVGVIAALTIAGGSIISTAPNASACSITSVNKGTGVVTCIDPDEGKDAPSNGGGGGGGGRHRSESAGDGGTSQQNGGSSGGGQQRSGNSGSGGGQSGPVWRAPTGKEFIAALPKDWQSFAKKSVGDDIPTGYCSPTNGGATWNGSSFAVGDGCNLREIPVNRGTPAPPAGGGGEPKQPAKPKISPALAAQIAIAKLKFTAAKPGAGPNRSDTDLPFDSPVGYPVWLWAEGGTTDTRTVSDKAGGQSVAITIRLNKITWDMGDGATAITCDDTGTEWLTTTEAGAKSPTCGHTFDKMGRYTITTTTHWTIEWQSGGQTGSQDYSLSQNREWAVGELQTIIR